MRRRAAAISADRPGERLPIPRTRDELERLSVTLNQMLGRLEEALERERGFVADAGHELRTPLALLRAELDFALHHAETEEELRAALREASVETDRLVQLAGDLLLLAGSERGELPLRVERVEACEVLESVRNRFAWRAAGSGRGRRGRDRPRPRRADRRRRRRPGGHGRLDRRPRSGSRRTRATRLAPRRRGRRSAPTCASCGSSRRRPDTGGPDRRSPPAGSGRSSSG